MSNHLTAQGRFDAWVRFASAALSALQPSEYAANTAADAADQLLEELEKRVRDWPEVYE